jgi:hypothetical protein
VVTALAQLQESTCPINFGADGSGVPISRQRSNCWRSTELVLSVFRRPVLPLGRFQGAGQVSKGRAPHLDVVSDDGRWPSE